jgi:hypothetical protein
MNEKIRARRLAANSTSDGEKKYVLEDVFWVPISNCSHTHSTSSALHAPRSEKLDTREVSSSDKTELGSANNHRRVLS